MSTADSSSDDFSSRARKPKKVTVDGQTVEKHSLADQIAAEQVDCANQAIRSRRGGLRINKFRPPGSI